ncbi:MAG TPA: hydantoinase/oxoprolinase family protein [Chloroflexota bacterium]|nr:hydantoinase/oxoprolinase family protein [Chloroflexota bacterium]
MTKFPGYRLGVDVGGTFTDVLLQNDADGRFYVAKTLTTPEDPSEGVLRAIRTCLDAGGARASDLASIVHGTTLVTNALIERRGARTALLTTRGFRDVLDIAREHRYDMYDLLLELPRPLTARELRFEADERVFADGTVYRPLDLASVDSAGDAMIRAGVEAVAVVFLHAYRDPTHERLAARRLSERFPGLRVSLSSEVAGEIREFERTSTTVANAYTQELLDRYLGRLEEALHEIGFAGRLMVMLSNGGIATAETAARFPVRVIESGPAAGALAAASAGRAGGYPNLLSFDMGGTTAKAGLIENGQPAVAGEFEVGRVYRFKAGSGIPIKAPTIDLIEIGAGGGSIARVDQFGLIKVGPESAGAAPGPAGYGRGGTRPTVTDADLVLGYLDPNFFLGGAMPLDLTAAEEAIRREIAAPLGLDVVAAAWAIHQIVNENMASAARMHAVERGKDVRRFPLFSFGGAGPVHAFRVAEILGQREILAPYGAGVGSTIGFLVAPVAFDFVRGAAGQLDRLDWGEISRLYAELEEEGRRLLAEARIAPGEVRIQRSCDMRLAGQAHEVTVAIPAGPLTVASAESIRQRFEETYLSLFKRAAPGVAVEALNWRVRVAGPPGEAPTAGQAQTRASAAEGAIKGYRPIYLPEVGARSRAPVYDRYALAPGDRFVGPAVVEERESTVVVGPNSRVWVDEHANLVIERG